MGVFKRKTKEEKLKDVNARIKAWEDTWGSVDEVSVYRLGLLEELYYKRNILENSK